MPKERDEVLAFIAAGATHIVLAGPTLPVTGGRSSAAWLAEEVIEPVVDLAR